MNYSSNFKSAATSCRKLQQANEYPAVVAYLREFFLLGDDFDGDAVTSDPRPSFAHASETSSTQMRKDILNIL